MWVVFYCFVETNIFSVSFIVFTSTRLRVLRYIGILGAGECFSQAFFQLLFLQLQNPYNTNRMNAISFFNYNKFIGLQKVLIRPNDFCGFNNIINNLIENQQISILTIIMQSFKGLISRNLVSQQSMSAITKKTEQFRKITLQSSQITISLLKIYETYLLQLSRIMSLLLEETGEHESYYKTLKSIYSQIYKQYHHFILDYLQTPSNQITNSNSQRYINFSGCALTFQKQMKNYTGSEAFLLELAKKYFKSQKNLLSSIQAYKQSFTEAKLIYNMDQKLRRYAACEQNHKNVEQDHTLVHQAKQKLLGKKKQVIQTFQLLSKEMSLHQNEVNVKTFLFLSKFNINLTQNLKKRLVITKQGRKRVQSIKIPNFFNSFTLEQIHVMTQSTNDFESRRKKLIIPNSPTGNIMDGNAENMKRLYAKLEKHIEVTKHEHLTMYQFHVQFYKSAQKKSVAQLKQSLSNFERNKKKIKEQFTKFCYQQFKNTLQIIRVTMDVYSEVQKKIGAKMQSVYENIEQLKIILQKLLQDVSFQVQKVLNPNKQKQNEIIEYKQKLSHIGGIIKTADDRLTNVIMHIKQSYNEILNIYELGINESHDRCTQFSKISQDKQQEMISHIREYKNERLKTTIFVELLNEQNRGTITFEDEIEKNNDFKKLKKPVQIEIIQKEKQPNLSLTPISSSKQQMEKQQLADIDDKNQISPQKNKRKHKQFIQTKVSFVQGQEFINTFSCALADKIILQGRLYVTSHRICFYSNFNPSLVFFRETFIQVPKKDIITLQKRKNGIFFDNSISITTKNGELFLTSFFKRNQAFKLVSQLIGLNYQQQAYEHDNAFQSDTSQMGSPEKKPKVQQPQQLEDDMKEQSLPSRLQAIQNMMNLYTYNFKQCAKGQFISDSLTAYKLLKVFLLDSQFSMNGKKYSSFCQYYKKSLLGHKDIETTSFDPPIKQYLNPSNITSSCPTKFTRKVNSVVPTPSSGIPFMPKWAKTSQSQSLYIISKHKWVLDTQLENSGAPYTDSFKVYYRTICESGTSPCRIVTSMFINFTKNVMVRSIIESKTQQQSKTQLGKQYEQLKKYLQSQQRQKMKSLKLMSGTKKDSEQQIIGDQTLNQQKIRSLEQKIENINIRHEKQIQKFKKQIKMFKGALIIIILISLIMWIV